MARDVLAYAVGNAASTTLSVAMSNSDTSATITSDTNFAAKSGEGMVIIDEDQATEEIAYSNSKSSNTLSIPLVNRGLEGGSAQAHSINASIKGILTVGMWNDMIDSLTNVLVKSTGALDTTKVVAMTGTQSIAGNKTFSGTTTFSADPSLGATVNIQVAGADPKRGIYVPSSAMYPSTTAGCAALTQVESSTNDVNIKVLDFDGAGTDKEYAEFGLPSPLYWDASTVTAQFVWYATAGSGTVNWEMQGLALSDDDALDTAFGTLQEVTDTLLATGDVHITAATSAITIAGTPTAGDWVQFKVARDPANDTNTSDARLMGVIVRFGIKQYNDA